jgi:hypothetical protein
MARRSKRAAHVWMKHRRANEKLDDLLLQEGGGSRWRPSSTRLSSATVVDLDTDDE